MGSINNVVTRDTAEKITTNRNSKTKHIDIHLMRDRRIVIEGCEDHKYCYLLSRQELDDVTTNADILSVILYEEYDYVAHSVYLYSKLFLPQSKVMEGITVTIEKVNDEEEIRYRAPWGCDSVSVSNELNGLFMAEGLIKYYDELLEKCRLCERDPEVLGHLDLVERTLAGTTGDVMKDYDLVHDLLKPMWNWTFIRLSPNEQFRLRYERLKSELDRIYNAHMTMVR